MQALLLMNDPQYFEAARALAERTIRKGGNDIESKSRYMFRLCTARRPSPSEVEDLVEDFTDHLKRFADDPEAAGKVIAVGESPPDNQMNATELAAWTMVANLVLNLDEVINKN